MYDNLIDYIFEAGIYYFLWLLAFFFLVCLLYYRKKPGILLCLIDAAISFVIGGIIAFLYDAFCPSIISAMLDTFYISDLLWVIGCGVLLPWYIAKGSFSD